nr:DNA primase large subunit isoform X2 [Agelaius phoeniceus]
MEFSSRGRLRHARLAGDRREQYPHSLQFYLEPPTESISLVEFESFAIDRLRLLKVVENLGVSYVRNSDAYKTKLESELRKLKFPYRALAEDDYEARRKDHISHFILRLAYCQSEDLRRWFLQQEMDLFRYRFSQLTDNLMQKFLEHVNLSFEASHVLPMLRTPELNAALQVGPHQSGAEGQDHRTVRVGRDLWKSSSPITLPRQSHLEQVTQEPGEF